MCHNAFPQCSAANRIGLVIGVLLGLGALAGDLAANEPAIDASSSDQRPSRVMPVASAPMSTSDQIEAKGLGLNNALTAALGTLDELKQATELVTLIAGLHEELQASIEERYRLVTALDHARAEQSLVKSRIDRAQEQFALLSRQAERSEAKIADLVIRRENSAEQLRVTNAAKRRAERAVDELRQKLDHSSKIAARVRLEGERLTSELDTARGRLKEVNAEIAAEREARSVADAERHRLRTQIAGMLQFVSLTENSVGGGPYQSDRRYSADGNRPSSDRYRILRPSNIRERPTSRSERVGYAGMGEFVTVIGKADGANWFEIKAHDGVRGFIYGDLIKPDR